MKKFFEVIKNSVEEFLIIVFLCGIILATLIQIIARISYKSIMWTQNISCICLICFIFIGISVGIKDEKHVSVYLFVNKMSRNLKKRIFLIVAIFNLFFLTMLGIFGVSISLWSYKFKVSGGIIPLYLIYSIIPFSCLLGILRIFEKLKNDITKKNVNFLLKK